VIFLQTKYIGLIVGILIIIIGASGILMSSGLFVNSITNVNVINNTYSGDGVSFNIPPNWKVSKIVANPNTNIDINSTDGTSITVAISPNPKGMSNQDLINSIQNPTNQDGTKEILNSTTTIDGNIAYENTYIVNDSNRFNQTMKEQQINFIKNGTTYGLIFDAPVQSFDTEISNFNITLNSFKVL
jgi:hypothetical protein